MKYHLVRLFFALLIAFFYGPADVSALVINEIRVDQPGADNEEYFELAGTPGESLNGLSYVVLGDGAAALGSGVVEAAINLDGLAIPTSGYLLVAESGFSLGIADHTVSLNFENSDNVSHLLVQGFSGIVNSDLDTNDDGSLDLTPWTLLIDSVAFIDSATAGEQVYSAHTVGPVPGGAPFHIYRSPDESGVFIAGSPTVGSNEETPGAANPVQTVPEPTALMLYSLGLLLMWFQRGSLTLSIFFRSAKLFPWNISRHSLAAVWCAATSVFLPMWNWTTADA